MLTPHGQVLSVLGAGLLALLVAMTVTGRLERLTKPVQALRVRATGR
ncbi:MAG: hypothetical protein JNJ54_36760 [Myxococcaceae bacterium]|nr:hypothetical protein [Myxococcaceae bacterium]